MGILNLMTLLKEKAPSCIRSLALDFYTGRTIACDASMAMYQFLIQTQGYNETQVVELMDKDGNRTGHLQGLFNRTISFLENGIKPVWVFDGKPPKLKNGELAKRKQAKEEAKQKAEEALEKGNMEQALMQNQRNVHITRQMRDDAVNMLRLMGCPVIEAPCEAEAQCAALCRAGKIYATATDDMDALTFRTPYLLKGFNNKKDPIYEICYDEMLKELDMTYDEFVDLCILCGCDYTAKIEGIGPATAFKLIKDHKNIENILELIKNGTVKYKVPEKFFYEDSRELFKNPQVLEADEINLEWNKPDEENLKRFMVEQKGFNDVRIENGLKKIRNKDNKGLQPRLENFFGKPIKVQSDMSKQASKMKKDPKKKSVAQKKKV